MCLKAIGAQLPLMRGTRPTVRMAVLQDGQRCHSALMQRGAFPLPRDLPPEFRHLLAQDQRKRGEHRPPRLCLGRFDPWPYTFYTLRLPGQGLHFPEGTLHGHLTILLYVELYDPMFHHPVLFHLRGSDPVAHPFGFVRWAAHRHWTPDYLLGGRTVAREETPCGCGVRIRVEF